MISTKTEVNQQAKGISDHDASGFKEIILSSDKLMMMFTERAWQPPTDVYETPEEIVIKTELSGVKPEEMVIILEENKLTIRGKRFDRDQRRKRVFKQMEINYGKFERAIIIHGPFNSEKTKAVYKEGFLEIVIPRVKKAKPITSPIEIIFGR